MNRISIKGILKAKNLPFREKNGRLSVRLDMSVKRTNNSPESEDIEVYVYGSNADEADLCLQLGSTLQLDGHVEKYRWQNSTGKLFYTMRIVADDILLVTKAIYSDYNASSIPDPEYIPGYEIDSITGRYVEMPIAPINEKDLPY